MTAPGAVRSGAATDDAAPTHGVLLQRLRAVAAPLLEGTGVAVPGPETALGDLFATLVDAVRVDLRPDRVWLLVVALQGALPTDDELRSVVRMLELSDQTGAAMHLLDATLAAMPAAGIGLPLEVVSDRPVVDVDFSARHNLHTGIQRVVRSTLPRWDETRELVPVAWSEGHTAYRRLGAHERDRVLAWAATTPAADGSSGTIDPTLVVPWRTTVVLLEVPQRAACERLTAVAQWSGNRLVAVGYDCIPVVSALSVPIEEPNRFVHYLTAIKYTDVVAGISVSATEEFRGFADMLPSQGLTGPRVVECLLPVDGGGVPDAAPATRAPGADPLVVCVGSFEPRKNQQAVLYAAELLWREGLRFRLRFIGGSGWGTGVAREVARLARRGRQVELRSAVTDAELDASYREARFTVFVSRHEGYGLPLAESLARGIPALTADFGSQLEIAEAGGAVWVDPRDDDAIVDGLRRLLTDDALVAELRQQIAARPARTWADYADELWAALDLPAADGAADGPAASPDGISA